MPMKAMKAMEKKMPMKAMKAMEKKTTPKPKTLPRVRFVFQRRRWKKGVLEPVPSEDEKGDE